MYGDIKWSKAEKKVARRAFDLAYRRECAALIKRVQKMAHDLDEPDDLWKLSDFLGEYRRDVDDKYDFRYSMLPEVLGCLVADGWISMDDLKGLDEEKREIIARVGRLRNVIS